jgi:cobalamin transport system substrate-binding protein
MEDDAWRIFFSFAVDLTNKFSPHRLRGGWRMLTRAKNRIVFRGLANVGIALFALIDLAAQPAASHFVTDETGRRVSVPDHPRRVISLAPNITETFYALGLGDQLIGDTDYCDYPPAAREKPHVGSLLNPSLEKIVALKPDLVLGDAEANRRETADELQRLGVPLYGLSAHSVEDTLRSIEDLGLVLGREAEAKTLVAGLRKRIETIRREVAGKPRPKVLFVVWYEPLITAGPRTFIADVIRRAGGVSVSDDLSGEWPRMSLESALARDPDVILFPRTAAFSPDLAEFRRLSGWRDFRAVRNGRMYFISDTINRPGPRLVDSLEEVARILHPPEAAR